jgi:hypothetical protein
MEKSLSQNYPARLLCFLIWIEEERLSLRNCCHHMFGDNSEDDFATTTMPTPHMISNGHFGKPGSKKL